MRVLTLWIALAVAGGAPAEESADASDERLRAKSEAAATALPRLGAALGEAWEAAPELSTQRLTVFARDLSSQQLRRGIQVLLSPRKDAGVSWIRTSDRYRLTGSLNRARLTEALLKGDRVLLRQRLDEHLRWAEETGLKQLSEGPILEGAAFGSLLDRLLQAGVLDLMGATGRERLLAEEPVVVPFGAFRGSRWERVLDNWITAIKPMYARYVGEARDRCAFVVTRESSTVDPSAGGLVVATVSPTGFRSGAKSAFRARGIFPSNRLLTDWQRHVTDPDAADRRFDLNLTPADGNRTGRPIQQTFEQVFESIAALSGCAVVADGYLRRSITLPPNFTLRGVTLPQLLSLFARYWKCEWQYLDDSKGVVVVRALYWWLEDAADVPDERLQNLASRFDGKRLPELDDFLVLSELSDAQLRKLTSELQICPGAEGFIAPFYYRLGVPPCLRFMRRLSPVQQQQALSTQGLSLDAVDPVLVAGQLGPTLVAEVGAITPEAMKGLHFWIEQSPQQQAGGSGLYTVRIRSHDRSGSHWEARFGSRLTP